MKTIKHIARHVRINEVRYLMNSTNQTYNNDQSWQDYIVHEFAAPYERNDRFILLRNEIDPRTPDAQLEPEEGKLLYADVDFEYNYYAADYEHYGSIAPGRGDGFVDTINKHVAPSLNLWLLHERSQNIEEPFELSSEYLQTYDNMYYALVKSDDGVPLSKDFFNRYFYEIADNIGGLSDFSTAGLPGYDAPQFVNKQVQEIYMDRQNIREQFPMFAKIKLTTLEKSDFSRLIETAGMEKEFIDFLIMHRGDSIANSEKLNPSDNDYTLPTHVITTPNGEEEILDEIYGYLLSDFYKHVDQNHGGSSQTGISEDESTCEYFESFIKNQILKARMEEYIQGSPAHMIYPVAYRLEKKNPETGETLFLKYFFNYEDMQEFRLYDSAILYGETYVYNIRVINAIVNPIRYTKTDDYSAGSKYNIHDTIIFVEDPYYEEEIKILDSPPISPDVELLTYRGIDNKVLILLNQMVDQKVEVPIIINESDWDSEMNTYGGFKDQYLAQGIPERDDQGRYSPILFESDDPTDFELFKCTKHPTSYDDFRNEHYRFISSGDPRKLTAASYEDTIVPNQPYYYMFRAQDVHGHVSNPSPIYEFILNKEGETLYPRIRIVDFAKPEPPVQKSKTFKKYLKIGFSPRQYQIPADEIQNIDDNLVGSHIPIGISDDNIIGSDRVFKFRIRSKNTGKLLDINVTFKKNKVIKA